ncbi:MULTISPECIES: DUF5682 family protein [unclassified Coleofasciculus]|uniref:DUF5682 family protein n=1 Tax=unclassified Coleofasciculus TaxID=2692782 RepID=UPI001880271E|nr:MULTISPECIES: DUF5682 family protein [unclassified Coleofasciculus]MBE9127670.1 hypothetical protein [Coleofasciculus sp. LEGE 07081]MBE9151008.1 hypothetical protein [Coleofasciculus sp. LEGE 07092]
MTSHIFGIRHHGPGSARSLRQALNTLQPDVILVEGPPEADKMLPLLVHPQMKPPVALLVYVPDQPQRSIYYPFAVFSPEWQAIHYGLTHQLPVRFIDLPQAHQLVATDLVTDVMDGDNRDETVPLTPDSQNLENEIRFDPLGWLGKAAGYSDGERWWEQLVEQRQESTDLFAAILEAMTALRVETLPGTSQQSENPIEAQREAYMRKTIRVAQKEGFQRIAVVCGAWHAPALTQMPPAKEDEALLKGLPKTKVEVTWVPWTYGLLSFRSGYGAGVESPGWYDHLWTVMQGSCGASQSDVAIRWMVKVAQLLRQQDLEASSAHLIEAIRLAESLAALRDRPLPGLPELKEATQTVLCFGSDLPMGLIHDKLIVGERMGKVPDETPMVPLQHDLQRQQKRLRMPAAATEKIYELDLRKENDLARSHLLHRLDFLGIQWGVSQQTRGKGTFKEGWRVQWQPEFAVKLIEAGIWGNTILDAATALAGDAAQKASELPVLTHLLDRVLLADLPNVVSNLMSRLQTETAIASDVAQLMEALPPLARVARYGNVRQTDTCIISHVVDGLVARICIGLPGACSSLDEDAAAQMYEGIAHVNRALSLLQNEDYKISWQQVLIQLADRQGLHGLLIGYSCRLLLDAGVFELEEAARRMGLALSTASEPPQAAAWVEGFLKGSGLLLLHDQQLWEVLDSWVTQLNDDTFIALFPLLRRTFSTFSVAERRQMGERVRRGDIHSPTSVGADGFDESKADTVLPLVRQLLGV